MSKNKKSAFKNITNIFLFLVMSLGLSSVAFADSLAPDITNVQFDPNEDGFTAGTATVSADVSDGTELEEEPAGVASVNFEITDEGENSVSCEGLDESAYSCDIDTSGLPDGDYTLIVTAIDNDNNSAEDNGTVVVVDNTAPNTTKNIEEQEVITSTTEIELDGDDGEGAGLDSTFYRLYSCDSDSEEFSFYEGPFTVSDTTGSHAEGCYTIDFYSVDYLENEEEVHSQNHTVNNTLNVDIGDEGCDDEAGFPYCGIQAAVDDASEGYLILVSPGTYDGVEIYESLTLKSTSTPEDTVIDGGVYVSADDVTIGGSGFGITGSECGVSAEEADGLSVLDNEIYGTGSGICLYSVGGSALSTISGNHIHDNSHGIWMEDVYNLAISDNLIENNLDEEDEFSGLHLDYGEDVTVSNNQILSNEVGIYVYGNNIYIDNNTVSGNVNYGAYVTGEGSQGVYFSNNEIDGGEYGIYSDDSEVYVNGDNIHDNEYGIYAEFSEVYVDAADIHDNEYGVYSESGFDSMYVNGSDVYSNVYGLYAYESYLSSTNNNIHDNEYGIYGEMSELNSEGDNVFDNTYGMYSEYGECCSLDVREDDIYGNDYGIYIYNDYLDVEESNIYDNRVGVYVGAGYEGSSNAYLDFNNIVNNTEAGLETGGDYSYVYVYASFNYWGNLFGPTVEDFTAGDPIVVDSEDDHVEYSPWITRDFETALEEDNYVGFEREAGGSWDLLSTPVYLEVTDLSQLIPSLQQEGTVALRFNSETQLWEEASSLEPLEAVYVYVSETLARFPVNALLTQPPSRNLYEGWNLWGPAPGGWDLASFILGENYNSISVEQAFNGLFRDLGAGLLPAFTSWVSPLIGDQYSYSCWVENDGSEFGYSCDNENSLYLGQGYWVSMNEDDEVFGSSTTPLSLEWLWD
jgi:parallel beta-helix repeat protein